MLTDCFDSDQHSMIFGDLRLWIIISNAEDSWIALPSKDGCSHSALSQSDYCTRGVLYKRPDPLKTVFNKHWQKFGKGEFLI
jgi:hypothetical protein